MSVQRNPFLSQDRPARLARSRGTARAANTPLVRALLIGGCAFADTVAIILAALVSGTLYHLFVYDMTGMIEPFVRLGCIVALLFVAPNFIRDEYAFRNAFELRQVFAPMFVSWTIAVLSVLILAFLTKTSAALSRGTLLLFYGLGFLSLVAARTLVAQVLRQWTRAGAMSVRRIFLVGDEAEIERFQTRYQPWNFGIRTVAAAVLRGDDTRDEDLALAAAAARMLRPDDVFILTPWSQTETIDACIDAFLRVPAAIHLGPEQVLDRFADVQIDRVGPISSLHLVRRPLNTFEIVQKRAFDIAASCFALVLAAPMFLMIALLIKLDSPGPVFFQQRRYGFNQEPFRIYKFRSMHTLDDGPTITQAARNDPRITRVGRLLRRTNLDEIPQLLNVLLGHMSLVGPRPHALAHDQHYERTIALYARRHNVKPGITGLAQVNGLRGETQAEGRMRARVEYDLYYIDHWSMWLDVRILFLTVFSKTAYANAV